MTVAFACTVRVIATLAAIAAAALTITTATVRSQVGHTRPPGFVSLSDAIPGIVVDVRYYVEVVLDDDHRVAASAEPSTIGRCRLE